MSGTLRGRAPRTPKAMPYRPKSKPVESVTRAEVVEALDPKPVPRPYYTSPDGGTCACGCGSPVVAGKRFISGHNLKSLPRTEEHKRRIAEGQSEAWKRRAAVAPSGDGVCACGCGAPVAAGRKFYLWHSLTASKRTPEWRAALSKGQRAAWDTKRTRKPVGSKRIDSHGYVIVKTGPRTHDERKEHLLVAETAAGRPIVPGEEVHHINHVRDDNRHENLVLCSAAEHRAIHSSLAALLPTLIASGAVVFDREQKEYRLP